MCFIWISFIVFPTYKINWGKEGKNTRKKKYSISNLCFQIDKNNQYDEKIDFTYIL